MLSECRFRRADAVESISTASIDSLQTKKPAPTIDKHSLEAGIMRKTRTYYEDLFISYPDVVTISQFCEMLGGIGDNTARRLLRSNRVEHFYIRNTYLIPKACVINYVLSDDYKQYCKKLKSQI